MIYHSRHNHYQEEVTLANKRLNLMAVCFFIICGLIAYKLFKIQINDHQYYTALAKDQQDFYSELQPARGQIFFQDLKENKLSTLATNRQYYLLYAIPTLVKNPQEISLQLAEYFQADQEKLEQQLSKPGDVYEPLIHKITDEQKSEIEKLDFAGLRFIEENWR